MPFNHFFISLDNVQWLFLCKMTKATVFSVHLFRVFKFRVRLKTRCHRQEQHCCLLSLLHLCGYAFQSFSVNTLHVVVTIKIRRVFTEQIDTNSHKSIVHTIWNVRYVFAAFSRSFLSVCFWIVHEECIAKTRRGKQSSKEKCQNKLKS